MFLLERAPIETPVFPLGNWVSFWGASVCKHAHNPNTALFNLCGPKWKTQNAFMLFFASCLWESLGGSIALYGTREIRIITKFTTWLFPNSAYVNICDALWWTDLQVGQTGVVQSSCLGQSAAQGWCFSPPAQLHPRARAEGREYQALLDYLFSL